MVADTATTIIAAHPEVEQIREWLRPIPDPEIPVLSIADLGILRDVAWSNNHETCIVTITPTYSGCPAVEVIADEIRRELHGHGIVNIAIRTQLAPPWTTEWMTETGRAALREYGIAPPGETPPSAHLIHISPDQCETQPACPLCGSTNTQRISQFGSTPCKSLHRCLSCMEPFDHFKAH